MSTFGQTIILRWIKGVYVTLGILLVFIPLLSIFAPAESPFHVSTYVVTLLGQYLCFALLALALDLVWG